MRKEGKYTLFETLSVEAVNDTFGPGKGIATDAVHAVGQIKGDFCHLTARPAVNLSQGSQNFIRIGAENNGNQ